MNIPRLVCVTVIVGTLISGCVSIPEVDPAAIARHNALVTDETVAGLSPASAEQFFSLSVRSDPVLAGMLFTFAGIAGGPPDAAVLDRIDHVSAVRSPDGLVAAFSGRFSRTTLSAAVRKAGFSRSGRGVWVDDGGVTRIRYLDRGLAVVETGVWAGPAAQTGPGEQIDPAAQTGPAAQTDPAAEGPDSAALPDTLTRQPAWARAGAPATDTNAPEPPASVRVWQITAGEFLLPYEAAYAEIRPDAARSGPGAAQSISGANGTWTVDGWFRMADERTARTALVILRLALLHVQDIPALEGLERGAIDTDRDAAVIHFTVTPIQLEQISRFLEVVMEVADEPGRD